MKKQIVIIFFVILGLVTVGCQVTNGVKQESSLDTLSHNSISTISEYYPFLNDTILDYQGEGNEFAEQKMYYEFIEGDRAQLKVMNAGTNLIRILEKKDGTLSEIYREGEFYHIENMIGTKPDKVSIILQEPLVVGNAWETGEGYTREITGVDVAIVTPYKELEALEVTTKYDNGGIQKDYFAKGIGPVARVYKEGDTVVKTLLRSVENKPLEQELIAYYPLFKDIDTVYVKDKILFYTNANIEKLLEDKLKNPPSSKLIAPLTKGVKLNSIYLDRGEWLVRVDFSEELLNEMNAGSTLETEILKSIVNTLGNFYDTDKVYISVEGRAYESGHYSIKEDENFKVNLEGINEFK